MDFKTLKYFISVAETLSLSKTADQFSVTQPTISQAISKMEHELGFLVLDRSSRPMALTDAGEFFYLRAQKLLKNYEFSATQGKQIDEGIPYTLKVLVPSMFEALLVMRPFRRYQKGRNGFGIDFTITPTSKIPEHLERHKADAAICCADVIQDHPEITAKVFRSFSYCIAVHEDHPLARAGKISPDKLSGLQCNALQDISTASEEHTRAFCTRVGINVDEKFRVTDVEHLVFQVGMNNCYGLIPDYFAPYIQSGIVCRSLEAEDLPHYQLALCYRKSGRSNVLQRMYFRLLEKQGPA